MELTAEIASKKLNGVMDAIVGHSSAIVAAHTDLGIPLEDAICAVVRKALTVRAADAGRQLNLAFAGEAEAQPRRKAS